jgi:hypothetical protein
MPYQSVFVSGCLQLMSAHRVPTNQILKTFQAQASHELAAGMILYAIVDNQKVAELQILQLQQLHARGPTFPPADHPTRCKVRVPDALQQTTAAALAGHSNIAIG